MKLTFARAMHIILRIGNEMVTPFLKLPFIRLAPVCVQKSDLHAVIVALVSGLFAHKKMRIGAH